MPLWPDRCQDGCDDCDGTGDSRRDRPLDRKAAWTSRAARVPTCAPRSLCNSNIALRWQPLDDERGAGARWVELWSLEEDGSFEVAQLAAGLETEVLCQPCPSSLERGQRVRLAPTAVEGDHELGVEPLPVGVDGDGTLEVRDDQVVLADDEPYIYQALEGGQAIVF